MPSGKQWIGMAGYTPMGWPSKKRVTWYERVYSDNPGYDPTTDIRPEEWEAAQRIAASISVPFPKASAATNWTSVTLPTFSTAASPGDIKVYVPGRANAVMQTKTLVFGENIFRSSRSDET